MTLAAKPAVVESKGLTTGEAVAGWLGALFMPILGFIVGIVAVSRGKIGTGVGMVLLSFFMLLFWIGVMQGG